jgi:6-pyruvoyltetrahydropterin/6-carboxytetrahydropterin synthase
MFKITVQTQFFASHQLILPDGTKEPSHSHNWQVEAQVARADIGNAGFVMNFLRLKALVEEITTEFDNISLNELDYFKKINPSAEYLAKYIFDLLAPALPADVTLEYICVEEQPGCRAKYCKE